ncbi:hypothetical protein OROHE_007915 [Orobanche hederae]
MWEFWRRHKRRVYVTLGVLGSGYLLYKLYDARRSRLSDLVKQLARERESEELIKAQIQAHFESVQGVADSTTLPHVMHLLDSRLAENLDLTQLTERLIQGKGQPNTLTTTEKLELWDRLKILSFTKMVSSLWAMIMLSLYIRVQVNILGRHLYIDTARGLESSDLLFDEAELIDKNDEQQFLACADLSNDGLLALISNAEAASLEVLKGKQLKDSFNVPVLHDTVILILETLMIMRSPHHWIGYLMPEDAGVYQPSSSSASYISHVTKFELLMGETRAVLSSAEFANIVEISLRAVVNAVLEDVIIYCGGNSLMSGIPLARLVPRIAHMSQLILTESNRSRYIQIIRSIPEVERFFTLLSSDLLQRLEENKREAAAYGLVRASQPVEALLFALMTAFTESMFSDLGRTALAVINESFFLKDNTPEEIAAVKPAKIPKKRTEMSSDDRKPANLDNRARDILYQNLDKATMVKIKNCKNAKEIWDTLAIMCEGTELIKENKLTIATQKFDNFKMKTGETVDQVDARFTEIINEINSLGKTYGNREMGLKVLRSLNREWSMKAVAMRESKDLNKINRKLVRK